MTSHVPFYRAGGGYICRPGFAKLIEVLGPLWERIDLCVPVYDSAPPPGFVAFRQDNVTVCGLPPYGGRFEGHALLQPRTILRHLRPHLLRAEAVCIIMPNYLSFLVWTACLLLRRRFAIIMVGDYAEMLRLGFRRRGIPFAGDAAYGVLRLVYHAMVRTSEVTLTAGEPLARIYGRGCRRVVPFIDSTFHERDIAGDVAVGGAGPRRILCVGRLDVNKGLRELLLACRDLTAEGLPIRLRMVGEGGHRAIVERMVADLGLADRVEMPGWVAMGPALQREYRSADVLVLASHSEGSPKVVIEAMANGVPVVATRVGSVPQVIEHGRSGLIVPPRDADALREALRALLTDEPLRRRMAAEGLVRARRYTMEAERAVLQAAFGRSGLTA